MNFDHVAILASWVGRQVVVTQIETDPVRRQRAGQEELRLQTRILKSEPLKIEAPAAKADFEFSETLAEAKKAVYPASVWQAEGSILLPSGQGAGTDVSFGQNALPMVAYAASGNTLSFKSMLANIKLQLKEGATSDDIAYVESSLRNDLRQIERARGGSDNGSLGAKKLVMVVGAGEMVHAVRHV